MVRLLTACATLLLVGALTACGGDQVHEGGQPNRATAAVQATEQQTVEPAARQVAESAQADQEVEAEQDREQRAQPLNRAPIADAGEDRTIGLVPSAVNLSAIGSRDPDGDRLTYRWTQLSGPTVGLSHSGPSSSAASFAKPRSEQTLVFEVVVTDPSGTSDRDTVTIVLQNSVPIASAGPDREVGRGETVSLDGWESSDGDGHSLSYRWAQVSGEPVVLSEGSARTLTFTAPEVTGVLDFSLTVNDGFADSEPAFVTISVVNALPLVAVLSPEAAPRGAHVSLDASESNDPEGGAVTFLWTQTSGADVALSAPTSAITSFVAPQSSGTLRFRVEVMDAEGGTASSALAVIITNDAPVADAGSAQTVATGEWARLDGSASSDPDGERLAHAWRQTAGEQVQLSNADSARPTFTAPNRAQTLRFALTVDDGDKSHTDVVTINVEYEPVLASNFDSISRWTTLMWESKEDAFTEQVRTDVRMYGPNRDLLMDVVCFENGSTAIGFRLVEFVRPERDADVPDRLEVMWRLDDGPVRRDMLEVSFLGDTPALYFQHGRQGFAEDWPQVLDGGELAVRIGYRGVQEEVFDLDALASSPVHGNLVNCGSY